MANCEIVDLDFMLTSSDPVEAAQIKGERSVQRVPPTNPHTLEGLRALGFVHGGSFHRVREALMTVNGVRRRFPVEPTIITDYSGAIETTVTVLRPPKPIIRALMGR